MLEGLSDFLIRHQGCGVGFDVAHPAGIGGGRVSITCRRCGARHEYTVSGVEVVREVQLDLARPRGREASAPARAPAAPEPPPRPEMPGPRERRGGGPLRLDPAGPTPVGGAAEGSWSGLAERIPWGRPERARRERGPEARPPWMAPGEPAPPGEPDPRSLQGIWSSRTTTVVLLVIAALAFAFAVYRVSTGEDEPAAPSPAPPGSVGEPGAPPGAAGKQDLPAAPSAPTPAPGGPDEPAGGIFRTEGYSLALPSGWRSASSDERVVLSAPGGEATVEIFFESRPDLTGAGFASLSGELLLDRHPGAAVTAPGPAPGGRDGFRIRARFPGGNETAYGFLDGPFRYLLLARVEDGAASSTAREVRELTASFRPD